jgi:hypothetical protein
MAHMGARDAFQMNLRYWLEFPNSVPIIISPANDRLFVEGYQSMSFGSKGHDGVDALRRFKEMIQMLSHIQYPKIIIAEYDSIAFRHEWPTTKPMEVAGMFFNEGDHSVFKGDYFGHPPLFMERETLACISLAFDNIPLTSEGGMWDRAFGYACQMAGVKRINFLDGKKPLGFTRNTIHKHEIPELQKAVKKGAVYFHGVKDPEVLHAIQTARKPVMP